VCQARGAQAVLDTFDRLSEALAQRTAGGGNVLQSVTLRRMDFAPGTRRLDPSHQPGGCAAGTAGAAGCVDRHMSRQPWTLLLQWRH